MPGRHADEGNERRGIARPPPKIAMVGDVSFYPTSDGRDASGIHRCIVAAIDRHSIYLVPICTYDGDPQQERTCLIAAGEMPGGELTRPQSYVAYGFLFSTPHEAYVSNHDNLSARFLCRLTPDLLVKVLTGLARTNNLQPNFTATFFGEIRDDRLAQLASSTTVRVETRHPRRSRAIKSRGHPTPVPPRS